MMPIHPRSKLRGILGRCGDKIEKWLRKEDTLIAAKSLFELLQRGAGK